MIATRIGFAPFFKSVAYLASQRVQPFMAKNKGYFMNRLAIEAGNSMIRRR